MLFYPKEDCKDEEVAVVIPRYKGKWFFVRHKGKKSYDFPFGDKKEGENLLETANRLLREEGGALEFRLWPVSSFGEMEGNRIVRGQIFFAAIETLSQLPPAEPPSRCLLDVSHMETAHRQAQLLQKTKKWLIERQTTIYCVSCGEINGAELVSHLANRIVDGIYSSPDKESRRVMDALAKDRGQKTIVEDFEGNAAHIREQGLQIFDLPLEREKSLTAVIGFRREIFLKILQTYKQWLSPNEDEIFSKYALPGEKKRITRHAHPVLCLQFIDDSLIEVRNSWMKGY